MRFMATLDNQMLTAFEKEDSVSDLQREAIGSFNYNKNKYVNQIANQVINLGFDRDYAFNIADRAKKDSFWRDLIAKEDDNINLIEGNFDALATSNYNPGDTTIPFEKDAQKIAFESVIKDQGDDVFLNQENQIGQRWAEYSKTLYNASVKNKIPKGDYLDPKTWEGDLLDTSAIDPKTDREFAQWGIEHIGQLNYNLLELGMAAGDVAIDDPDVAFSLYSMLDIYDKLPNFTKKGWGRFAKGVATDPFTYMGLGALYQTAKGLFGKKLTTEAVKQSLLGNIKKRFPMYAVGSAEGAAYMGLDEFHRQTIGIKAEELSQRDITNQLLSIGVGGVFGFGGTAVGDLAITGVKKGIDQFKGMPKIDPFPTFEIPKIELAENTLGSTFGNLTLKFKSKDGTKVIEPTDIQDPVMKLYSPSLLGIMNAVNDPNISIPKKQLENPNFHSGQYILKEADKFGLKKEELEYMGLTGYLESDKAKRITLEELQELIKDRPFPIFQKSLVHPDKMKDYLPPGTETEFEKNYKFEPFNPVGDHSGGALHPNQVDISSYNRYKGSTLREFVDHKDFRFEHKDQLPKVFKPENLENMNMNPEIHMPEFKDFKLFLEDIFIPLRREGIYQSLSPDYTRGNFPNLVDDVDSTRMDMASSTDFAYFMHPEIKRKSVGFKIDNSNISNYFKSLNDRGINVDTQLTPYAVHTAKYFNISDPVKLRRARDKNTKMLNVYGGIEDGLYPSKNELNVLDPRERNINSRFTKMSLIDNFTNRFLENIKNDPITPTKTIYLRTWKKLWEDYGDILIKPSKFNEKGKTSALNIKEEVLLFSSFPAFRRAFKSILDSYNTLLYSAGLPSSYGKLPQAIDPDINGLAFYNYGGSKLSAADIAFLSDTKKVNDVKEKVIGEFTKGKGHNRKAYTLEQLSQAKNDPSFIQFRDQRLNEFQEKIRQARLDNLEIAAPGRTATPYVTEINLNDFLITGLHWLALDNPHYYTKNMLTGSNTLSIPIDKNFPSDNELGLVTYYGHTDGLSKYWLMQPENTVLSGIKTNDQKAYEQDFHRLTRSITRRLENISKKASNNELDLKVHGNTSYMTKWDKDILMDIYYKRNFIDSEGVTMGGEGTRRKEILKAMARDDFIERGYLRLSNNIRSKDGDMSVGHKLIDAITEYQRLSGYSDQFDEKLLPKEIGKAKFIHNHISSWRTEAQDNPREIVLGTYTDYTQPKEIARKAKGQQSYGSTVRPRGSAPMYTDASAELIEKTLKDYEAETKAIERELKDLTPLPFTEKKQNEVERLQKEIDIRKRVYDKIASSQSMASPAFARTPSGIYRDLYPGSHFGGSLPKDVTEITHSLIVDSKYKGGDAIVIGEMQSDPQQYLRQQGMHVGTPKKLKELFKIARAEEELLYGVDLEKLQGGSLKTREITNMLEKSPFGQRGLGYGQNDRFGTIAPNIPFVGSPGDSSKPHKLMFKRLFTMAVDENKDYVVLTAPEYVHRRWKQAGVGMLQAYKDLQTTFLNTAKELDPDAKLEGIRMKTVSSISSPTLDIDNPSGTLKESTFEDLYNERDFRVRMKLPNIKLKALYEIQDLLLKETREKGLDLLETSDSRKGFQDQIFPKIVFFLNREASTLSNVFGQRSYITKASGGKLPTLPMPGAYGRGFVIDPQMMETPSSKNRVGFEASDDGSIMLDPGSIGDQITERYQQLKEWSQIFDKPMSEGERRNRTSFDLNHPFREKINKILNKTDNNIIKLEKTLGVYTGDSSDVRSIINKEPMHVAIKITPKMKKSIENGQSLYSIPGLSMGVGGASLVGSIAQEQGTENGNTR